MNTNMKVVCAIIKDEHIFLKEWIDHHLSIGFDYIYLYEDKESKSHESIVQHYDNVFLRRYETDSQIQELLHLQGNSRRQLVLYSWFCETYQKQYDWVAFIDLDEFIFFEDGWSLDKLCDAFESHSSVLLYWKMMGASGHIKRPFCGVKEAYTKNVPLLECDDKWCYKSLVNLKKYQGLEDLHTAIGAVKTDYSQNSNEHNVSECYEKAWINHYFTKSWEDWCDRIFKRGGTLNGHRTLAQFFDINTDMESMRKELISKVSHLIPKGTYWLDRKNKIIAGGNMHLFKK